MSMGAGHFVEAIVLLVAASLCVHVLLKRPVRRELRAHLGLSIMAGAVAILGLSILIWLGTNSELARRGTVAGVGLASLIAIVRSRSGYGRRRGLPPGSLGLATSLDAIDDPTFYARSAERWGPVFKMSQIHRPVVCITDLESGLEFISANDAALVQSDWSFNRLVPGGYLEYMNGETHTRHRDVFAPAFTREAVEASRPTMTRVAIEQLAQIAAAGGTGGVHPEPYLLPIAQASLLRMVLGVHRGHTAFDKLSEYFTDLNRPIELFLPAPRSSKESFGWLAATVAELAAKKDGEGGIAAPSVLSDLVTNDPSIAANETVVGNVVLMVKEGSIMVRGMLRWILKMLADHPEWVHKIRHAAGDPERSDVLTSAFVMETIRLYESPYVYRHAVQDVQMGPYKIPSGWLVRLCLTEAHAAGRGSSTNNFDPNPFLAREANPATFCPFGHGRHECLGAEVAVEIAKTVVREAALGYDLRTVQDGPAWRINRHWGLWRPSRELRVALEPVQS